MLRALLVAIVVAALGWSAYWVVGSRAFDRGVDGWLADRRAEGWVAEASQTRVLGYPNRFDMTLSDLQLADPDTGLAWSAPFFQILTLSYRPHHVIAVWPDEQTVSTPFENITIRSDDIRASLRLADRRSLALESATFVSEGVTLVSDAGWTAALESGRLAVEHVPATAATYRLGFEATGLRPAEQARRMVDRTGALPEQIETLRLDAEVAFDAPWDRSAIEDARPQPTSVRLREVRATWGQLDLQAAGELAIGPDGTPTGQIAVRAVNWREMLALAVESGALPERFAPTVERALQTLARSSGSPETLDATISFRNGRMFYGIIPLGPAPRLVLR